MAVLNLRDVPDDLAHALRVEAAQAAMGIKDYCVAIFESRKKIADDLAGVVGENPACAPRGKSADIIGDKYADAMIENLRESGRRREKVAEENPVPNIQPLPEKQAALAKLRGMVAGIENNMLISPSMGEDGNLSDPAAHEVDLCGEKFYNEVDGENYICGKEKHGTKVKHGDWIKV